MAHLCISKLGNRYIYSSGNDLSPGRYHVITWIDVDSLSNEPPGTYCNKNKEALTNSVVNNICKLSVILFRTQLLNWSGIILTNGIYSDAVSSEIALLCNLLYTLTVCCWGLVLLDPFCQCYCMYTGTRTITMLTHCENNNPQWCGFNHWGRVTHICVGKLTIIGSDNGLSPEQRQVII